MDVFPSGHSDERHTREGVANQFIFSIMIRMRKGVDATMNAGTKRVHDAAMKIFYNFDVPFADVNRDTKNYSELD